MMERSGVQSRSDRGTTTDLHDELFGVGPDPRVVFGGGECYCQGNQKHKEFGDCIFY